MSNRRSPHPGSASRESATEARERAKEHLRIGRRRKRPKVAADDGRRNKLTNHRRALIARTGMLPLDFLTAVYRDELWSEYTQHVAADGRTVYWLPSPKATKIPVDLDQRIRAAADAAPYVHRKMPQGLEIKDKGQREILAEQLKSLPTRELEMLERVFARLEQVPQSLKQAAIVGAKTYTQDGQVINPLEDERKT